MDASSPRDRSLFIWTFVVVACIARFVRLDADPKFEYWIFYIEDEGRWIETARNLALFGNPRLYGISKLHLALSPLFQAVNFGVFELLGVSFWSARLFTAACGAAIVVASYLMLRRMTTGLALFLGLAVIALEPLSLSLSRTAIPEIPSLLFTLLAFIAVSNATRMRGMVGAGVLMAVAVGMKGTTALMVPTFVVMAALSEAGESARARIGRGAAFVLGLLIPAALGIAIAVGAGLLNTEIFEGLWPTLRHTLKPGNVYTIIDRFVSPETEYGIVKMLLLGVWLGSWTVPFHKEYQRTLLGKFYCLSAIWAAGWMLVWGSNGYTPARYSCHVILPLAIHLAAGLALWKMLRPSRVLANVRQLCSHRGFGFAVWLVLPAAVIASISLVSVVEAVGVPMERLSHKLLIFGAALIAFAGIVRVIRLPANAAYGFIAIPVVAAVLWTTIEEGVALTLERADAEQFLPVVEFAIISSVAGLFLARAAGTIGILKRAGVKAFLGAAAAAGLLLGSAPVLLNPTYSIRDASLDIARRFQGSALIQSSGAGALLLETPLPYRDAIEQGTRVEGILNYDRHVRPGPEFASEITYRLIVHPRYHYPSRPLMDSGAALLEIYRNEEVAGRSSAVQ